MEDLTYKEIHLLVVLFPIQSNTAVWDPTFGVALGGHFCLWWPWLRWM